MIKVPAPAAAVIAKAGALADLHPWLYRVLLLTGGAILVYEGLRPNRQGEAA